MSEKLFVDMSLLEFTAIGLQRLRKLDHKDDTVKLIEVLCTARDVLKKIDDINKRTPNDKKVAFTENGLEIDEEWLNYFHPIKKVGGHGK